jgi:hypothetical protein
LHKAATVGRGLYHLTPIANHTASTHAMDKKAKKKIQTLNQRLQKLRQQLAGSKKQMDDPEEVKNLERQIAETEAELASLKGR